MANTVTQRTILGSGSDKNIIRLINIVSDGSQETDLVIFNNSSFLNNAAKGKLLGVWATGSDCVVRLEWDQTADSPVISLNPVSGIHVCFRQFGGISNPNGAGATGNLLLTTAGLAATEEITIIIKICQN